MPYGKTPMKMNYDSPMKAGHSPMKMQGYFFTCIPVIPELLPLPIGKPLVSRGPSQTCDSPTWPSNVGLPSNLLIV